MAIHPSAKAGQRNGQAQPALLESWVILAIAESSAMGHLDIVAIIDLKPAIQAKCDEGSLKALLWPPTECQFATQKLIGN